MRKRKGRRCVGSEMGIVSGMHLLRLKGVGVFESALLRRKGVRGFGDALDASWLGMEPEGSGVALGAWG